MNQSGDIFNSAGRVLIGMTVGGDKDDEELQGFYDKRRNIKFPVKVRMSRRNCSADLLFNSQWGQFSLIGVTPHSPYRF